MSDIVHKGPGQIGATRHPATAVEAAGKDTQFLLLGIPCALCFLTAVVVALYALLMQLFPQLNLPNPENFVAIDWPYGLQTLFVAGLALLLLAIPFYLAACWQIAHNVSMQAIAGCPLCQQHDLLRVSRTRKDRLLTLSGIRVARYQCRDCRWNGRRVFRKSFHPLQIDPAQDQTANGASAAAAIDKPLQTAVTAPAQDDPEVNALPAPEAKPDSGPDHEPAQAAARPTVVDDSDYAGPAEEAVATEEPQEIAQPSTAADSARPVAQTAAAEDVGLEQDQLHNSVKKARIKTAFGVNLKAEPRSDARWVGMLGPETVVVLLQDLKQEDGTIWHHVSAGEQIGWVTCSCLEAVE